MTDAPSPHFEPRSQTAILPIWLSYTLSFILTSLLYVSFLVIRLFFVNGDIQTSLFVAESTYLFGGFLFALVILILPWIFIAVIHTLFSMARFLTLIYFIVTGALSVFCLNCLTSIPFPFDFGETTRLQIIFTAVHNQGLYLLSCGALFGATYCILGVPKTIRQSE